MTSQLIATEAKDRVIRGSIGAEQAYFALLLCVQMLSYGLFGGTMQAANKATEKCIKSAFWQLMKHA